MNLILMSDTIIRRVIILGTLAVLGVIAVQSYWVFRTWDLHSEEFDQKVRIALHNVAKDLEKIGSPLPGEGLISQISTNYYVVNINDNINTNTLEFYLTQHLESVGLQEDFEYGIYDCASDWMVYGDYISYDKDKEVELDLRDDLQTFDEFIYYFGVRFPERTGAILESMRFTIVFSIILFLTVSFFIYTLSIILRQKRLSEQQRDFINNMTHEFKTPISTIKISASTFLNNPKVKEDPRLSQYAKIINEQNERLNSQVEKVLNIARIEQDTFKLKKESINLHELVENIAESTRLKIKERGGVLTTKLDSNRPVISADKLHLTNILHNLIDNAVKYCEESPKITVETSSVRGGTLLKIIDNGLGIAKEQQAKVFEKFYRVPTGNLHNVKGFGLGLFYVKNICQSHGWDLNLKSEQGRGTEIWIQM